MVVSNVYTPNFSQKTAAVCMLCVCVCGRTVLMWSVLMMEVMPLKWNCTMLVTWCNLYLYVYTISFGKWYIITGKI